MKHAPTRKLSDAVFRGRETDYSFKVYPITAPITDQPAIFIISRRIVDKRGKGHQITVCIGETDSIQRELKKHRRAPCVKQHSANVVCILREKAEDARRIVIEDIVAGRFFSCVKNVYKPKIEPARKTRSSRSEDLRKPARRNAKNTLIKPAPRSSGVSRTRATRTAAARTRIQGSVDSNRRQHRLSDQKRPAAGRAKTRTAGGAGSRKKAAA